MMSDYQMCNKCVMDTSDPEITFDSNGICNYCRQYDDIKQKIWYPNKKGYQILEQTIEKIKNDGKGKEYDCIMGLSGGVDSSYLAYISKVKFGLRPLLLHIDTGWNSESANHNIRQIVKKLDCDLVNIVIDFDVMSKLQLAFFMSGVANQDTPQDHAIFANLYKFAAEKNISHIISGHNFASESILPKAWGYNALDSRHIKHIYKRFMNEKLRNFPTLGFFEYNFYFPYIKRMHIFCPLNYMNYNKMDAIKELENNLGWKYYEGKHHESQFTRFFQSHYLPHKFGYDKRRAHLSSLILAEQITRQEALERLEKEHYPEEMLKKDRELICRKLQISEQQFDDLMKVPNCSFSVYPSDILLYKMFRKIGDVKAIVTKVVK